jgi:plastocyanin
MRTIQIALVGMFALAAPAVAQPKKAPPAPAAAGVTVKGTVKVTDGGKAVNDATIVVYLVPTKGTAAPDKGEPKTSEIHQVKRTFKPDLLAITQGDSVIFPNDDDGFHNVFSPKPKFDLGTLAKGKNASKSQVFKEQGVVDVYCNIHPDMAATILILPNRFHASVKDGAFTLTNVPPGSYNLFAYTRRAKPVSTPITVEKEPVIKDLALTRGPEVPHTNKFGGKYTGGKVYP